MTGGTRQVQALIVVDMQAAFVAGPGAVPEAARLLAEIAVLVDAARGAGSLIVYLQNDGPPGAVDEPGTPGWRLHRPVADDDVVIRKASDDGFHGTDLAVLLAVRHVRGLAVCGVMSEMCVSATARTAMSLGFTVVLPHRAHATYDIPAGPGIDEAVPARMVARVAEWALGDRVHVVAGAADVAFVPAARPEAPR